MYARGMTTRDIQGHLEEIYGIEVSPTLISQVTDAISEEVILWQNRPLDEVYPIVYLDAIRIKVRHDSRVINKAVYLAIGVNMDGIKEVLRMWTAEAIYTTNAIESLNMLLRKVTKNRGHFPSDEAMFKLLYLALRNIAKKWTMPIRDWESALNQFSILFESRMLN